MRKVNNVGAVVVMVSMVAGCTWWKANGQAVIQDIGKVTACVLQHEASDVDPTFEGIAEECGPMAVADVIAIVEAQKQLGDAGVNLPAKAAAVHHRQAKK